MAQHEVRFTIPERKLGKSDIEFRVRRNGKLLGTLGISKGALVWIRASKKSGYRLAWRELDKLAVEHGRRRRRSDRVTKRLIDKNESTWNSRAYKERRNKTTVTSHLRRKRIFSRSPRHLVFMNANFVFTGKFRYGARVDCKRAVQARGGMCDHNRLTHQTDVLVVGSLGSPSYFMKRYGRKIEKAKGYRKKTGRPMIIAEDRWDRYLRGANGIKSTSEN